MGLSFIYSPRSWPRRSSKTPSAFRRAALVAAFYADVGEADPGTH